MTKKEKIDEILNNFRFQRVRKTMEFLDWKYSGDKNYPSIEELIKSAKERLNRAYDTLESNNGYPYFSTSSGGFKATAVRLYGDIELELDFIVESWDTQH